nr:MAG TPA: Flagellar and Swarming motility protein [Bacteriophage sp.]
MNFIKVPDAKNNPMLINLEEVAYIKTNNNGDAWIGMRNGAAVVTLDTPEEIYEILCGEGGNHNEHK